MSNRVHLFEELYGDSTPVPLHQPSRRKPRARPGEPIVGVLYNPYSHHNKGQDLIVAGLPNVTVGLPHGRDQITEVLSSFASDGVDYLIINGGDGTVRDVLTCGHAVFGDNWPELAVLPKGKTNALNADLGAPSDWNVEQAIDAFASGRRIKRRPLTISKADGTGPAVNGFIFGAGAFTTGITAGQDAHRMGAFNSLAVAATATWGCLQVLFGTDANPWRRGAGITIELLPGHEPLARSRFGDPGRRSFVLASTLEKIPAGLKPFGPPRPGLKLAALDHPRRRVIAAFPAILAGYQPAWLAEAGVHQVDAHGFEIDLEDQFILDGEAFPPGKYVVSQGASLSFVVP